MTYVSRRLWQGCFLLLLTGYALTIFAAPSAPLLQDYPDWVYQGVLLAKVFTHHAAPGYVLKHYPVPNSLTTLGIAALSLALGWKLAAKFWLLFVLACLAFANLRLFYKLQSRNFAVLLILACSTIVGLDFLNGSINFQLGLALYLVVLSLLLTPKASHITISFLLLACFFTHMLPCAAGLLALTALAIQERRWQRLLPAVPTCVCLGWYMLARNLENSGAKQSSLHLLPALLATFAFLLWSASGRSKITPASTAKTLALVVPGTFSGVLLQAKIADILGMLGPFNVLAGYPDVSHVLWTPFLFRWIGLFGAILAVIAFVVWVQSSWNLQQSQDNRRFLSVTSLALLLFSLLCPLDALGVTGINNRFLHLGLASGLTVVSTTPYHRWITGLGLAILPLCLCNLYQFDRTQRFQQTVSLPYGISNPFGTLPVVLTTRRDFYTDLQGGIYGRTIFPTAMFQPSVPATK